MKKIQIFALSLLLVGAPLSMMAESLYDGPETETEATTLSVSGNTAHITNAAGKTLTIYNLTGVKVASYRIDGNDKSITLDLQKGCYILKVGNVVRKVSIR